jgi:hypothetical protein
MYRETFPDPSTTDPAIEMARFSAPCLAARLQSTQ